ncbi:divalent-cation tolerance protein CutA [Chelativorans sp. J32]|uniref:divalent-cation tolerance protein CutA n=1 Tax=Chelativorans sp. J32 TaxID=935840 RepID=UPI00048A1EA7|nr:divalent-cation tolerance protein CutA [Chelativorans sp. J32]
MPLRFIDIWVNCPDQKTAEKIADACIAEKLAACANIFPPIASRYRWKGAIETATEVPLLLKTRSEHFEAVCEAVRTLHSYEVPFITATEISQVDQAYADWLRAETKEPA